MIDPRPGGLTEKEILVLRPLVGDVVYKTDVDGLVIDSLLITYKEFDDEFNTVNFWCYSTLFKKDRFVSESELNYYSLLQEDE